MARFIDAEKLWKKLDEAGLFYDRRDRHIAHGVVEEMPVADVVEVVRCKECIKRYTRDCALWYGTTANNGQINDYFCGAGTLDANFYCAYGAKREA